MMKSPAFRQLPIQRLIKCRQLKTGIEPSNHRTKGSRFAVRGSRYRDHEYVRLGTLSLLAGIDLLTGEFVFTPAHGSWLNTMDEISTLKSAS